MEAIATAMPTGSFAVDSIFAQRRIETERQAIGGSSRFTMEGVRIFGNIFNYATSRWALGCIVTAVILNRTNVYARTRWNLQLSWKVRLLLRITPILLLAVQSREILQSIQCQTSPEFASLSWGNTSINSNLFYSKNGRFLHKMSSILLFGPSDKNSCQAVYMIPSEQSTEIIEQDLERERPPVELKGSLPLLWPLFKTFAFSQFVETLSCAVLGRQMVTEYGMSLFELSLAFTEAEAVAVNKSEIGGLKTSITSATWIYDPTGVKTKTHNNRSKILKYVNTSPEVLLVGFISGMNHLTSHFLGLFNQQPNFRLLNTGIWGLAYTVSILGSISLFSIDDEPDQSIFRFPTVCIISFIPHVLIIFSIIGCSVIYIIALLLTAISPPLMTDEIDESVLNSNWPFLNRIQLAHKNMQANVSFSRIHVTLSMDFYTALLRTGVSLMSMANEAVYLNESRGVSIKQRTWLEDDRLQELETVGLNWLGPIARLHESGADLTDGLSDDIGLVSAEDRSIDTIYPSLSGYTREMINHTSGTGDRKRARISSTVAGTTERSGRWFMAFELCLGFSRLLLSCYGAFNLWLIARLGIQTQPRWLLWMIRPPNYMLKNLTSRNNLDTNWANDHVDDFDENFESRKQIDRDIEAEFRRLATQDRQNWTCVDESELDAGLYKWWLDGGWWGEKDNSGTFVPTQQEHDDDVTSVISSRTTDEEYWHQDSSDESGYQTPTQTSSLLLRESKTNLPYHDTTLTLSKLAQLLDPKTPDQRAEAEALAIHLSNDEIVTRSRFRKLRQKSRAKVLTSTLLHRPPNFVPSSSPDSKLTAEEESQILEHLIISRRGLATTDTYQHQRPTTWTGSNSSNFIGMGENSPQCVVCQTSPRCIIVWPCRCLSLCNDCRVTLAMNNFEKCVCCRRNVASFSRIFVP